MKIAVCVTGQIRTGVVCFPSIRHYIGDLWENCDIFVHTWDTESNSPWTLGGTAILHTPLNEYYPVTKETLSIFYSLYTPKVMVVDKYDDKKQPGLFYSMKMCYKYMTEFSIENNVNYDFVIKIRPDLLIHKSKTLLEDINLITRTNEIIYCDNQNKSKKICNIEDIMYIGRKETMNFLMNFCDVRRNSSHASHLGGYDWQAHMYMWLTFGLGFLCKSMKNNLVGVYYNNEFLNASPNSAANYWYSQKLPYDKVDSFWQNDI